MRDSRAGEKAWIGLVLYVAIYDWFALRSGRPTMSEAFYVNVSKSRTGYGVMLTFWLYLTGHLTRRLPKQVDMFTLFGRKYVTQVDYKQVP